MEKNIENIISELLKLLAVKPEKISIAEQEAGNWLVDLQISEPETGILIGYHGETISALQLMANLLLYKKTGEWGKLIINIGDYRQKREEILVKLAEETVQKVKTSGQPMALFHLNPFERRTIHTLLAEDPTVATLSEGEGRNRHLVIKLK